MCKTRKSSRGKVINLIRNFQAEILGKNKEQQAQLEHEVPFGSFYQKTFATYWLNIYLRTWIFFESWGGASTICWLKKIPLKISSLALLALHLKPIKVGSASDNKEKKWVNEILKFYSIFSINNIQLLMRFCLLLQCR